jgi:hypothetical protein
LLINVILILIILFPQYLHAQQNKGTLEVGGGIMGESSFLSKQDSTISGNKLLHAYGGGGLRMFGETKLVGPIELMGSASFMSHQGRGEYNYTNNKKIPTEIGSMEKLEFDLLKYDFTLGLNFTLIKRPSFQYYIGGGVHGAFIDIQWNSFEYKDRNGSSDRGLIQETNGESTESGNTTGHYFSSGLVFSGQEFGIRIEAMLLDSYTSAFASLGDQRFSYRNFFISLMLNRIIF